MKRFILAALLLLYSGLLEAQTISSYELRFYNPGASAPFQTATFLAGDAICNQDAPAGSSVNPRRVVWDDPANVGRVCIADQATVLLAFPLGNYEGTLVAVNEAGASPESNRAPFVRLDPPDVISGLRFVR